VDVGDEVVRSSTGFATGVGGSRETCGAILAGAQAIGIRYGRTDRAIPREPAVERTGELVRAFRTEFGAVSCRDLVAPFADMADPARKAQCGRLVGFVARWVAATVAGARP